MQLLQFGVVDGEWSDPSLLVPISVIPISGVYLILIGVTAIWIHGDGARSGMLISTGGIKPIRVLALLGLFILPSGYEGIRDRSGIARSLSVLECCAGIIFQIIIDFALQAREVIEHVIGVHVEWFPRIVEEVK